MPKVSYSLKTLDVADGETEIKSIKAGKEFLLVCSVQDLRPDPAPGTPPPPDNPFANMRGVFAAYCDVLFDQNLASVRVAEKQQLAFAATSSPTGTIILSFVVAPAVLRSTSPIPYDNRTLVGRQQTAQALAKGLNLILGANAVRATSIDRSVPARYAIEFYGLPDIIEPLLRANLPGQPAIVSAFPMITELVRGDVNNPDSYKAAFVFSPEFQNVKSAKHLANVSGIAEVGAVATSFDPGDTAIHELFRVRMLAKPFGSSGAASSGALSFRPDFARLTRPVDYTLLFGEMHGVQHSDIAVSPASLTITP